MSGIPVLLFLDVSGGELLVILFVVFLVFGPDKMPEMARKAGRMMNQMKKASSDLTREFKKETSGLEKEIKSAHSQVDEQLSSVSREYTRTKTQINTEIHQKTEPGTKTENTFRKENDSTSDDLPAAPSKDKETT